jgi:hypothetical protein
MAGIVTGVWTGILACAATAVSAAGAEHGPIPRLETRVHTTRATALALDSAERLALTVSLDKTARIWDVETGEPVQTVPMPAGAGLAGALYAGALSPDGRKAVLGGALAGGREHEYAVSIMDAGAGALISRITGLPGPAAAIDIGPYGRRIALGLLGGGIRMFDIRGPSPLGAVSSDATHTYALRLCSNGDVLAADSRGIITRYDSALISRSRAEPVSGKRPWSLSLAPGGQLVAVGYQDTALIVILDAATLRTRHMLSAKPHIGAHTAIGAWSADSTRLFAVFSRFGMRSLPDDSIYVTQWRLGAGRAAALRWRAIPGAGVSAAASLRDGALLIAGERPRLAKISAAGPLAYRYDGPGLISRLAAPRRLSLSADGLSVTIEDGAGSRVMYSVAKGRIGYQTVRRTHDRQAPAGARRVGVIARSGPVRIDSWGKTLSARTDRERVWRRTVAAPVEALAAAVERPVVAALLADGTVRWYEANRGRELAALYLHDDARQWASWTPDGKWDCAPGAEALLSLQFNRPVHRSPQRFAVRRESALGYTPGLALERVAAGKNMRAGEAPRPLDSLEHLLPPALSLVTPGSGSRLSVNPATVWVRVSGGVADDIRLRGALNGGPLDVATRGLGVHRGDEHVRALKVMLEPGRNRLYLRAENRNGPGRALQASFTYGHESHHDSHDGKNLAVLAIGVSNHSDPALRLEFASSDALSFARALQHQQGRLYQRVETVALLDSQATGNAVEAACSALGDALGEQDVFVVYFAGHMLRDAAGRHWFATWEAHRDAPAKTGLSVEHIAACIGGSDAVTLAFIDACYAGAVGEAYQQSLHMAGRALAVPDGPAAIFLSSRDDQRSQERRSLQGGVFTHALIEGLRGKADYAGDGRITVAMLDLFVSQQVPALSDGAQTPVVIKPAGVPDFALARIREGE